MLVSLIPLRAMDDTYHIDSKPIYAENNGRKRRLFFSNNAGRSLQLRIKNGSIFNGYGKKLKDGKTLFEDSIQDQKVINFEFKPEESLTVRLGKVILSQKNYCEGKNYGFGKIITPNHFNGLRGISIESEDREHDAVRMICVYRLEGNNCPFCSYKFTTQEDIVVTPCGHALHSACVMLHLKKIKNCPVCHSSLPAVERISGGTNYQRVSEPIRITR